MSPLFIKIYFIVGMLYPYISVLKKTRRDRGPMDFEWLSIIAKYLVPISLLGFGTAFMLCNYRKYASWLKDKLFADKTDN